MEDIDYIMLIKGNNLVHCTILAYSLWYLGRSQNITVYPYIFIIYSLLLYKTYSLLVLATQSIEARARQRGCMQACTIGLSINEDPKLEKGKVKKGSATWSFMRSSSHVSLRDCVYYNVYHNLLFSISAVT